MINKTILVGRSTSEGELRYTNSGTATHNFTLAVERPFKSKNNGKETDFIPIVTWKGLAEVCANYLNKGRLVAVEGRIQTRNYEKDGKRVYVTEVIADNVRFLESNRDEAGNDHTYDKKTDPFVDDGTPINVEPDSLPF